MISYIKYVAYYGLTLVDAAINFTLSLIRIYPKMEMAENFMVSTHTHRINKVVKLRETEKREKISQAREQIRKIRENEQDL